MSAHPDEAYLIWLYSQIGTVKLKNPARTHWSLIRQLYKKEFIWLVANDDNRAEDGRDLREEFLDQHEPVLNLDPDWLHLGCSMLEMLIALSRRLSFDTDVDAREWFWELLENMGIGMAQSSDKQYTQETEYDVNEVLERVIWRTYAPDGTGGMFPLQNPPQDQRRVEIWYQLNAYLAPDV